MDISPPVNVVMVTYNQEKYIAKAIESVLIQKTTFPFLIIIGEDFSTDRTRLICKQYANRFPDKILLLENETNYGLVRNYKRLFDVCTAKYIAILEGDDYWIDENKLQKQKEILDSDTEIGLVHAARYTLYDDQNIIVPLSKEAIASNLKKQGNVYEFLIHGNFIGPSTVLFRRSILTEYIDYQFFIDNNFQTIDYALWIGISLHSKIVFMKDIVSVYRVRSSSISNNPSISAQQNFLQTARVVANHFLEKYPIDHFSMLKFDENTNELLFSNSLFYGDYKYAKQFAALVSKKSIKMKIKYLFSKTKTTVYLYSLFSNLLLKRRLSNNSVKVDQNVL